MAWPSWKGHTQAPGRVRGHSLSACACPWGRGKAPAALAERAASVKYNLSTTACWQQGTLLPLPLPHAGIQ